MVSQVVKLLDLCFISTPNLGVQVLTGLNLNANSALIQNLYSQETTPLQAVHLAIDTGLEKSDKGARVKAYIRSVHFPLHPTPLILQQLAGRNLPKT